MDLNSVGKLLTRIAINYPTFKRNILDSEGKIQKVVAEEWERQIGYLDYEEALDRLDEWMYNSDKAPRPVDLKKFKPARKSEEWHSPEPHIWHLEFMQWDTQRMHGRLYDQEEREYVHDPTYEDGYHYNQDGRICTIDGKVVH